jgi:hypothetical protein
MTPTPPVRAPGLARKLRFLPRLGASTEIAIDIGASTHDVLGRLTAGFDALATAGPTTR